MEKKKEGMKWWMQRGGWEKNERGVEEKAREGEEEKNVVEGNKAIGGGEGRRRPGYLLVYS